eukprot:3941078-Rhodomonas_salina.5
MLLRDAQYWPSVWCYALATDVRGTKLAYGATRSNDNFMLKDFGVEDKVAPYARPVLDIA